MASHARASGHAAVDQPCGHCSHCRSFCLFTIIKLKFAMCRLLIQILEGTPLDRWPAWPGVERSIDSIALLCCTATSEKSKQWLPCSAVAHYNRGALYIEDWWPLPQRLEARALCRTSQLRKEVTLGGPCRFRLATVAYLTVLLGVQTGKSCCRIHQLVRLCRCGKRRLIKQHVPNNAHFTPVCPLK